MDYVNSSQRSVFFFCFKETACLDRVVDCLKTIINKYGRPLLLPQDQRPSDWMLIRYKNEQFRTFVDFIRVGNCHSLVLICIHTNTLKK